MLLSVQNFIEAPAASAIDVSSIQVNFQPALPSQYVLLKNGTVLKKVSGVATESRMCEVMGKPRAGKHLVRVKFNSSGNYSTILISDGKVTPNNQLAWTSGSLAGNVWHEVRVEEVAPDTYQYTVNGNGLYRGKAKNLTFYFHSNVSEMEFDVGQLGTALPAGFEWL